MVIFIYTNADSKTKLDDRTYMHTVNTDRMKLNTVAREEHIHW